MRVKPAPGLCVRDPLTKQLLPPEGIDVPDDSIFWTKMLNDRDVVQVFSPAPDTAAAAGECEGAVDEGEDQGERND
ncbi:DUF2635 domain-containing protein [Paraburkholderia sp. BR14320]|uniref:DUF2635 domain-containing protein n=1 Tax=unclassified Paraburkholderia TaxID=2615204 RepID=UPI0034CE6E30